MNGYSGRRQRCRSTELSSRQETTSTGGPSPQACRCTSLTLSPDLMTSGISVSTSSRVHSGHAISISRATRLPTWISSRPFLSRSTSCQSTVGFGVASAISRCALADSSAARVARSARASASAADLRAARTSTRLQTSVATATSSARPAITFAQVDASTSDTVIPSTDNRRLP